MRLLITVLALALHCGTYGVSAAGNPPPANYAKQPITTKGPPKCTGANEVYTLCDNNSCLRDCSTFGRTDLACRPICTPGCICKPNHLRNSKGVCVKASQCDTNVCPAKNQIISDCASPCQEDCEHLGQNRTCSSLPCKIACICKPGFYKNSNGECVVPSKCDCGNNQVLDLCYNPCPPETCKTIGALFKCAVPATCKPACKCKLNYKRNSDGVCVDIRECPQPFPCKDVNTEYNACPGCVDERCNQSTPLACKDIVGELPCRPSCRCKSGFCKDDTGKCVKPAPKCTKPHEVYTECENNSCQRDCSTFGITDLACKPICTPGCICERNFLRNADGDCVKPEECGVDVCPEKNQQFSNCASPCAEDCMTMGKNITCNFLVCNIGCECKPGFFKNSKRECVAPEECDCGENQELDTCYNPCPPEKCEDIGKLFKCAVPDTCVSSCVCKRNFKRDLDGNCVYIGECPQPFICETTAHYDACPDCVDETCLQTDRILCVPEQCLPSCRCNDGLCRDPDLNCVDKVPYESCNGDPNAYFNKCGDPCPVTCNSLDLGLQCEDICSREGACKCKPGYVRHYDILGKCIPVEQCPKCGENEFFDCGSACDTVCGKIGVPCNIINKKCVEQCYCNEGFARDSKNVCIPVASCPATKPCNGDVNADPANGCKCKCGFALDAKGKCVAQKCSDINAEYVTCPNPCPGGTCLSPNFSPCKVACKPCGCQCKKGFVKKSSTDATCIALKSCPKY